MDEKCRVPGDQESVSERQRVPQRRLRRRVRATQRRSAVYDCCTHRRWLSRVRARRDRVYRFRLWAAGLSKSTGHHRGPSLPIFRRSLQRRRLCRFAIQSPPRGLQRAEREITAITSLGRRHNEPRSDGPFPGLMVAGPRDSKPPAPRSFFIRLGDHVIVKGEDEERSLPPCIPTHRSKSSSFMRRREDRGAGTTPPKRSRKFRGPLNPPTTCFA